MCLMATISPLGVSTTAGFFLIAPMAKIATCGWLIIGVPITLPNVPTLVIVKQAGGQVVNVSGGDEVLDTRELLATNGLMTEEMLQAIQQYFV